jgi:hypothetical protein
VIFAYGETVKVVRASLATDGYGNQVYDWPTATRTPHDGCGVAQGAKGGATEDLTGDRDAIISDRIVLMPSGADVVATDRLEVRGRDYEVVGEPFDWVNPFTGTAFGVVVYCNRVEG